MQSLSLYAIAMGVLALAVALGLYLRVKSAPEGNAPIARIARYIRDGAMAFLVREYKVLAVYAVVVSSALFLGFQSQGLGLHAAGAFVSGAFLSVLAGFFGMKAATYGNVRTTEAARSKGMAAALVMALDGGAVMGLCVAGLGLIGLGADLSALRERRWAHARDGDPRVRGGRFVDRAVRAHRRRHLYEGGRRRR